MRKTNKSYAYAAEEQQGIAFTENTGDDWVKPAARSGFVEFVDDDGQKRAIVLDFSDGFFYNIATRDGADDSGESAAKTDKAKRTSYDPLEHFCNLDQQSEYEEDEDEEEDRD